MKNLTKIILSAAVAFAVALPAASFAAGPSRAGSGMGGDTSVSTNTTSNTNTNTNTNQNTSSNTNQTNTYSNNVSTRTSTTYSSNTRSSRNLRLTPSVIRDLQRRGLPIPTDPNADPYAGLNSASYSNTNTASNQGSMNQSITNRSVTTNTSNTGNTGENYFVPDDPVNTIPPRQPLPQNREAFVAGLYGAWLDRAPDNAGLNFWLGNSYNGDQSVQQLYRAFVDSTEYKSKNESNTAFVTRLYRSMLFREPDQAGLNFWVNDLNKGQKTRQDMVTAFLNSTEFNTSVRPTLDQILAPGTITRNQVPTTRAAFVASLYQNVLDRQPDAAGLQFWSDNAGTGEAGVQHLYTAFFVSQEYLNKRESNAGFVNRLYFSMLYRPLDPQGHAFWTAQLDSGKMTRNDMLQAFFQSTEFRTQVLPQLSQDLR